MLRQIALLLVVLGARPAGFGSSECSGSGRREGTGVGGCDEVDDPAEKQKKCQPYRPPLPAVTTLFRFVLRWKAAERGCGR